jgi:hypothetical protein
MSKKPFLIFVLVAVVAALAAWQFSEQQRPSDSGFADERLFPGLEERINNVEKIEIVGPGNKVLTTLVKMEDRWAVTDRFNFRADWVSVRGLLEALVEAKVVEHKTKKEEFFPRLGVENVQSVDATGLMVRLDDSDELSLILGKTAAGGVGYYVRPLLGERALLVNEFLEMSGDPMAWIDREILALHADRIQEMYVRHGDGEIIHAIRGGGEKNEFVLENTPEGREVSSPWTVNSYPSTLTSVVAENIRPAEGDLDDSVTTLLFIASNGLNVQLEIYQEEGQYWLRVSANAEPSSAVAAASLAASGEEIAPVDPVTEAEELNNRHYGWEFEIPEFKYNSWAKRMDDLLAPPSDGVEESLGVMAPAEGS